MLARIRWLPLPLLVAFGMLALLAVACSSSRSEITARLDIDGEPELGQPFTLTLEIASALPYTNVNAQITLPEGIEVVGDAPRWKLAAVQPSERYKFVTQAQVMENNYYEILGSGWVTHTYPDGTTSTPAADADYLYVIVEGDDTWVSKRPPENTWKGSGYGGVTPVKSELVDTRLALSDHLEANRPVEVVYTVTPRVDLANVIVGFSGVDGGARMDDPQVTTTGENTMMPLALSEETRALDMTTRWEGSMAQGQTYTFRVTLHISDNGERQMTAWVDERYPIDGHTVIGKPDVLDFQFYIPRWARTWQYYFGEVWTFLFEKLGL